MNANLRRDIELILLGVSLTKTDRDRVLTLSPGSFSKEVDEVIQGIRDKDAAPAKRFFKDRGVVLEKGQDFIEAMVAKVSDMNKRERLNRIASELMMSRGFESTDQMLDRFKLALKQIEDMQ